MHILALLGAVITFIAVWYWRLKIMKDVAEDGRKLAETALNLPRKLRFKARTGKGGLGMVDDPREAAVILMLEMAQARGVLTERQQDAIRAEIIHNFAFSETDADELIAQAGWLSRNAGASHSTVGRMTDYVRTTANLSQRELVDLDGMLVTVSEAEGSPTDAQLDLLEIYRRKTGLRV